MSMFDEKYASKANASGANDTTDVNRLAKFIQADEIQRRACDDDSVPCSLYDYSRVWRGKRDFDEWRDSGGDTFRSHRGRR